MAMDFDVGDAHWAFRNRKFIISEVVSMIEYKNEVVEMPIKFTSLINDKKVSELNELFNQRITEGWELVAHTYIGDQSTTTNVLLITFKPTKEAASPIEYKSEAIETSTKWVGSMMNEKDMSKFNELLSLHIVDGWELAAHTFLSAGGGQSNVMFITFKKTK